MSRVSLARQQLSDAGQHATYYPAVPEGHRVENDGRVILHILNDSAEDVQITVQTGFSRGGLKLADRVVIAPAGGSTFIGPLDAETYNQTNAGVGQVYIDYSAVENVSVAALLIPKGVI